MTEFLEACMMVSFGLSWPLSIAKSYKSGTARGKSLIFLLFILFGYFCGIVSKLIADTITYVFVFYCINFIMVGVDLCLWLRNRRLDLKRAAVDEDKKIG